MPLDETVSCLDKEIDCLNDDDGQDWLMGIGVKRSLFSKDFMRLEWVQTTAEKLAVRRRRQCTFQQRKFSSLEGNGLASTVPGGYYRLHVYMASHNGVWYAILKLAKDNPGKLENLVPGMTMAKSQDTLVFLETNLPGNLIRERTVEDAFYFITRNANGIGFFGANVKVDDLVQLV